MPSIARRLRLISLSWKRFASWFSSRLAFFLFDDGQESVVSFHAIATRFTGNLALYLFEQLVNGLLCYFTGFSKQPQIHWVGDVPRDNQRKAEFARLFKVPGIRWSLRIPEEPSL